VIEAIVVETLESAPPDATHWSSRGLATKHGISHTTVREIWRRVRRPMSFSAAAGRYYDDPSRADPPMTELRSETPDARTAMLDVPGARFAYDMRKPRVRATERCC
jgi:hypothetical protein